MARDDDLRRIGIGPQGAEDFRGQVPMDAVFGVLNEHHRPLVEDHRDDHPDDAARTEGEIGEVVSFMFGVPAVPPRTPARQKFDEKDTGEPRASVHTRVMFSQIYFFN